MTHTQVPFPENFLWGASTAAHQIEGNNTNSDWWVKEHAAGTHIQEPSLDACDSYHRWNEDMDTLAGLGFTDYRFSIEWARIEAGRGPLLPRRGSPTTAAWSRAPSSAACAP